MIGLMLRDLLALRKRFWLAGAYCVFGPMVMRTLGKSSLVVVVVGVAYALLMTGLARAETGWI